MRPTVAELEALCEGTDASTLVVADSSGTTVEKPAAWATVVYEREWQKPHFLLGCESNCTNNRGELYGLAQGLWFADYKFLLKPRSRVLFVSDSEVTVRGGTREYSREGQGPLWATVEFFEKRGFRFSWKWVPRNSNPANAWCDKAAGELRLVMKDHLMGLAESDR
jgi:ribonuclease HI